MNRRALFGFLGVSPVAAAGAVLASQHSQTGSPTEKKPDGWKQGNVVSLHDGDGHQVHLMPGRDGSLWLKPSGVGPWRRVVLE